MKFKKPIEVEAGISDGDPLFPLGQNGYLLSSDGSNVNWVSPGGLSAETAEAIVQPIKANEALTKGDPLYIVGYQLGQDVNIVAKADSSDVAKMPVVGLADDDYANQAFGTMTAFGSFNGAFDTSGGTEGWSVGDIIFVKPLGGLTNIKPGGTDLIQNVAIVSRVSTQTGELEVIALGRTNDVPNLPTGRLFVGTAANTSLTSDVVYVDDANDRVGIGTTSPQSRLEVNDGSNDLQMRVGSLTAGISPSMRFQGKNTANNTNYYADITLDAENGKLLFKDPGTSGGSIGQNPMTLDSLGNVGIGTTIPDALLHVRAATDVTGTIEVQGGKSVVTSIGEINSELNFGSNDASATGGIGGSIKSVTESTNGSYVGMSFYTTQQSRNPVLKEAMRITNAGNVGIGTTSPGENLSIVGVSTEAQLSLQAGPTTYSAYKFNVRTQAAENGLYMEMGGTKFLKAYGYENADSVSLGILNSEDLIYMKAGGNVGIGTTNPSEKLSVHGGAIQTGNSGVNGTLGDSFFFASTLYPTSWRNKIQSSISQTLGDGKLIFSMVHTSPQNFSDILTLVNNGNVGIGTDSPNSKIHIADATSPIFTFQRLDTLIVANEVIGQLNFKSTDSTDTGVNASIKVIKQDLGVATVPMAITFETGVSDTVEERMRIDSVGNVGIGTDLSVGLPDKVVIKTGGQGVIKDALMLTTGQSDNFAGTGVRINMSGVSEANSDVRHSYIESATSSAGNDHYLAFATNSAGSDATERMRIDADGNVGIGTTSPQAKLDIEGGVNISDSLQFTGSGTGSLTSNGLNEISLNVVDSNDGNNPDNFLIRLDNTGDGGFYAKTLELGDVEGVENETKITIDSTNSKIILANGNVGIGTTSPSEKLEVAGNVILDSTNARLKIKGGVAGTNSGIDWTFNTDSTVYAKMELDYDTRGSTGLLIDSGYPMTLDYSQGSFSVKRNGSSELTILNGNVGIGTTSPATVYSKVLQINAAGNGSTLRLTDAGSGSAVGNGLELLQYGVDSYIINRENGVMRFWNNNSSKMVILANGNVGIGTTSPANKLDVVGISRFTHSSSTGYRGAIETITDNAFPTWDIGWLHARSSSSNYGNVARFNDQNGSQIGAITYSGSTGVSYGTTSDYRLKENIEEISDSISRVKKLKPCRFNFTTEKNRVVDGFIAHEVQEVVPEAVHGEKDALQEDGSIDTQTLEVSRLIPVLTKALQEAIIKIEELELRIQTIENN